MNSPLPVLFACGLLKNMLPIKSVSATREHRKGTYRFFGIEPDETHDDTKLIFCINQALSWDCKVTQCQKHRKDGYSAERIK